MSEGGREGGVVSIGRKAVYQEQEVEMETGGASRNIDASRIIPTLDQDCQIDLSKLFSYTISACAFEDLVSKV